MLHLIWYILSFNRRLVAKSIMHHALRCCGDRARIVVQLGGLVTHLFSLQAGRHFIPRYYRLHTWGPLCCILHKYKLHIPAG